MHSPGRKVFKVSKHHNTREIANVFNTPSNHNATPPDSWGEDRKGDCLEMRSTIYIQPPDKEDLSWIWTFSGWERSDIKYKKHFRVSRALNKCCVSSSQQPRVGLRTLGNVMGNRRETLWGSCQVGQCFYLTGTNIVRLPVFPLVE